VRQTAASTEKATQSNPNVSLDYYTIVDDRTYHLLKAREPYMPQLPARVTYVYVPGACDRYVALKAALTYKFVTVRRHSHYLLLDSSAKGPYLPTYLLQGTLWASPFLAMLTGNTVLVGSSIRCPRPIQQVALPQPPAPPAFPHGDAAALQQMPEMPALKQTETYSDIEQHFYVEDFAMAMTASAMGVLLRIVDQSSCAQRLSDNTQLPRHLSNQIAALVRMICSLSHHSGRVHVLSATSATCGAVQSQGRAMAMPFEHCRWGQAPALLHDRARSSDRMWLPARCIVARSPWSISFGCGRGGVCSFGSSLACLVCIPPAAVPMARCHPDSA
jgi:hypothetical protein